MAQRAAEGPELLSAGAPPPGGTEDRSFARDLNLDQIVAAIAGDREERDLITRVLFSTAARCRGGAIPPGGVQDLENPALFGVVQHFRSSSARCAPTCPRR
jgi:hypothetical protein